MKNILIILSILLIITSLSRNLNAQISQEIPFNEDNQLLGLGTQYIISSEVLGEERPIIIALPQGYEESDANYPVLYLLDGRGNIKHAVATAEMLAESGVVPPMIIVAIQSLNRARDLTPSQAGKNSYGSTGTSGIPQSGGAPKFLDFLENELIPYVESNFRTHPYRVLEGHSLGGLFSVFALMGKPDLFDAFIIQSPALWWNKEEMAEVGKTFFTENQELDKVIYFGIGGNEGWGMKQELKRYVEVIESSMPKNLRWKHEEVGDEDHDEARLILNYYGMKYIFSDLKNLEIGAGNFKAEAFLEAENQLMNQYGKLAKRPPMKYVSLYSSLIEQDQISDAIIVLKRACEAYPNYVGLMANLSHLYEKTNQIQNAIEAYQLAIEISKRYKLGHEEGYKKEIERLETEY